MSTGFCFEDLHHQGVLGMLDSNVLQIV